MGLAGRNLDLGGKEKKNERRRNEGPFRVKSLAGASQTQRSRERKTYRNEEGDEPRGKG